MKSLFNCLILCGLVFLVGVLGRQPETADGDAAERSGDVWLITSLEASNSNPFVNTTVLVDRHRDRQRCAGARRHPVEFSANGGAFLPATANPGDRADHRWPGVHHLRCYGRRAATSYRRGSRRSPRRSRSSTATRTHTGALQIWSINPAAGSYAGGETVILTGKGIRTRSRSISPSRVSSTRRSSIRSSRAFRSRARAPSPSGRRSRPPPTRPSPRPPMSRSRQGRNHRRAESDLSFGLHLHLRLRHRRRSGDLRCRALLRPLPGRRDRHHPRPQLRSRCHQGTRQDLRRGLLPFQGQQLLAQVERWSANQIEVITPRFSLTPLTEDQNAGVLADPTSTAATTSRRTTSSSSSPTSPSPRSRASHRPPVRSTAAPS